MAIPGLPLLAQAAPGFARSIARSNGRLPALVSSVSSWPTALIYIPTYGAAKPRHMDHFECSAFAQLDERGTHMASHTSYRWLIVVAFSIVSALAQAASGFNITQSDESKIAIGMDATEVQRLLGPPERVFRYPRQPGPTWTYNVLGAPFGITKFDIDFGADGKVVSANERIIGTIW